VTVEPTWLENLTAIFKDNVYIGAGGRVLLDPKFTPPRWLSIKGRYTMSPLGMVDFGPEAGELKESPFGNNMAFSKEAFRKYGEFRTDLGPQPGSEVRSEDTEFGSRLLAAGERLHYEPSAIVYHAVPDKRIKKSYFLKWWLDNARAEFRISGVPPGTRWYIHGVPLYLLRRLIGWTLSWLVSVNPSRRFYRKIKVWVCLGRILECYHQSQTARRRIQGSPRIGLYDR
jgi:GT2 family glycosyltransferase